MIMDALLQFDPAGTAITTSADSTNVIDLGANRDLGIGLYRGKLAVLVGTTFTASSASATLNVQIEGAPDNGSGSPGGYSVINESGTIAIGLLVAGTRAAQFDLASIADAIAPQQGYGVTLTTTSSSTSATVSSATGVQEGQFVNAPGIVPGTTVASLSGTTVTLSAAATASATVTATFTTQIPPPRFLKLHYVVASGPFTAGTVSAQIVADPADAQIYYQPGFTQPY